jgi:hypothetical protein
LHHLLHYLLFSYLTVLLVQGTENLDVFERDPFLKLNGTEVDVRKLRERGPRFAEKPLRIELSRSAYLNMINETTELKNLGLYLQRILTHARQFRNRPFFLTD